MSGSLGYYDFVDIQRVSGLIRESSVDVTFPLVGVGLTAYSSDDDGEFKGAAVSLGIKGPPAFGVGSNVTNTKVFAFREEDIADAIKVLIEANLIVSSYQSKPGQKGKAITYRYYEVQNDDGYTESMLEISVNENGNNRTLFIGSLGKYKYGDSNYSETKRVAEKREQTQRNSTDNEKK